MRPSQKSNRNRGKNNRPKGLGNVVNRVFESAGPEGKVRGTPQQIIDKYEQLARDAQTAGDRVTAENFLQHAEHYLRLLSAAQAEQQAHQPQPQGGQGHANGHARRDDDERDRYPGSGDQPSYEAPEEPQPVRQPEPMQASGGMETIEPEGEGEAEGPALVATPEAGEEQPAARPRARRRRTRRDKPAEGGDAPEGKGGADAEAVSG